jgi:hypothetical protein
MEPFAAGVISPRYFPVESYPTRVPVVLSIARAFRVVASDPVGPRLEVYAVSDCEGCTASTSVADSEAEPTISGVTRGDSVACPRGMPEARRIEEINMREWVAFIFVLGLMNQFDWGI